MCGTYSTERGFPFFIFWFLFSNDFASTICVNDEGFIWFESGATVVVWVPNTKCENHVLSISFKLRPTYSPTYFEWQQKIKLQTCKIAAHEEDGLYIPHSPDEATEEEEDEEEEEVDETVHFDEVSEIRFPGEVGPLGDRRLCKIRCVKGKWVGPLCATNEEGILLKREIVMCRHSRP